VVDADIKGFFDNLDHEWLMRMLEQGVKDQRFLSLIRKWLKAGILEEDRRVVYPITGTHQGGVVSAVVANIYPHYALDLWLERVVKPQCQGDVMLMRFADDSVCCFQLWQYCQRFYKVLGLRLEKFKLELSAAKTRVIKFIRFETKDNESFDFLGFEYRWATSRAGGTLITMRTAKKKFYAVMTAFLTWIKEDQSKMDTSAILNKLRQKLQSIQRHAELLHDSEATNHRVLELNNALYEVSNTEESGAIKPHAEIREGAAR